MYIKRAISEKLLEIHRYYPVVTVTGPRQSGKTSLCRHLFPDYKYVNLEDLTTRALAASDPTSFIDSLGNMAIIDEVQNVPQILSMIQVRVDENPDMHFIITGSSNFSLLRAMTQSLAGRTAMLTLLPFSFQEMTHAQKDIPTWQLLTRGQYPGILANGIPTEIFYPSYYTTYVERDVRDLMKIKDLLKFDTFVRLLAARVGSEFNASSIAKQAGVSAPTISEWLSVLDTSYITYTLRPYSANLTKRLTKMPKAYFYDTGLLCYLLRIEDEAQYMSSPLRGAIFENMAMGELIKSQFNNARTPEITFYREQSGKEVDAVVKDKEGIHLYEMKYTSTFKTEFAVNMKYVSSLLGVFPDNTLIYDGESMPPALINIRNI